jgi:hypothetical protein
VVSSAASGETCTAFTKVEAVEIGADHHDQARPAVVIRAKVIVVRASFYLVSGRKTSPRK